jgi:hypothetical protein
MESIFEVPWRDVERKHLNAFLASASGEGLIGEAKATDPLSHLKRKVATFAAGRSAPTGLPP